jgi:hypothetical protein
MAWCLDPGAFPYQNIGVNVTGSGNTALATARRAAHHFAQLSQVYEIYLYGPVACSSPGVIRLVLTVDELYYSKYIQLLKAPRGFQPDVSQTTRRLNVAGSTLGWFWEPLVAVLGATELEVLLVPIDWQARLDNINQDLDLRDLPLTAAGVAAARWYDRSLGHFRIPEFNAPPLELHPTQSPSRF